MTREEVLALAASSAKPIPFEEDGLCVFLRPLKASERTDAKEWQTVHGDETGYQFLYVRSVCDADGVRLFTDDDAPLVATFPSSSVEAVIEAILKLNRMGAHEKKAPSTTTPSTSSPSD